MVETKPALLHLRRQLRQPFVNGRPAAKHFQPFRLAIQNGLLQVEEPEVVNVVVEVHVHASHVVVQEEPAGLGQVETPVAEQHRTNGERRFEQHLRTVMRQVGLLGNLIHGEAFLIVVQHLEDAEFDHQAGDLEHDRAKSDFLGKTLCLQGGETLFGVHFFLRRFEHVVGFWGE